MSTFLNVLGVIAIAILSGGMQHLIVRAGNKGRPWLPEIWFGLWMIISVVFAALNLVRHEYGWMIFFIASAFIDGWNWWRWHKKRKQKKPIGALVGAKTRAKLEGLVKKQREATIPMN